MKTKIIYISGNELFDMNDIRSAFEEVRKHLNLDKETILFGVPVDKDSAELETTTHQDTYTTLDTPIIADQETNQTFEEPIEEKQITEEIVIEQPIIEQDFKDSIVEQTIEDKTSEIEKSLEESPIIPIKRRGRQKKQEETSKETSVITEHKVNSILTVLSSNSVNQQEEHIETEEDTTSNLVIENIAEEQDPKEELVIEKITESIDEAQVPIEETYEEKEAPDLEDILDELPPLNESIITNKENDELIHVMDDDISIDKTLEKLAIEMSEAQKELKSEDQKPATKSKISKLRNILPFKQSKHKDEGLGDLFGWAGVAANDEEFSIPNFFKGATNK